MNLPCCKSRHRNVKSHRCANALLYNNPRPHARVSHCNVLSGAPSSAMILDVLQRVPLSLFVLLTRLSRELCRCLSSPSRRLPLQGVTLRLCSFGWRRSSVVCCKKCHSPTSFSPTELARQLLCHSVAASPPPRASLSNYKRRGEMDLLSVFGPIGETTLRRCRLSYP